VNTSQAVTHNMLQILEIQSIYRHLPRWTDGCCAVYSVRLSSKKSNPSASIMIPPFLLFVLHPLDVMGEKYSKNRFFWEKRTLKKCCTFSTKKIQKK
jgi:hypothetical protein